MRETKRLNDEMHLCTKTRPSSINRPHDVEVHHCRFFEWMPESIVALCFSPDGERIAVGKNDSNIEIWRVEVSRVAFPIRLEKVIAGDGAQIGLRSLAWITTDDPNDWDDGNAFIHIQRSHIHAVITTVLISIIDYRFSFSSWWLSS